MFVSCEIRTHAHRSGLRPERSALDHSAKLTLVEVDHENVYKKLTMALHLQESNFLNLNITGPLAQLVRASC